MNIKLHKHGSLSDRSITMEGDDLFSLVITTERNKPRGISESRDNKGEFIEPEKEMQKLILTKEEAHALMLMLQKYLY